MSHIICLVGAEGTMKEEIAYNLLQKGFLTCTSSPRGAQALSEGLSNSKGIEFTTIHLVADESIRAKRMMLNVKDRTQLKYIKNLRTIPDIAQSIVRDRAMFDTVSCDYTISTNGCLEAVIARIEQIIAR